MVIQRIIKLHLPSPGTKTQVINCLFPSVHRNKHFIFKLEKHHKAESLPENVNLSIKNVSDDMKQTDETTGISYQRWNLVLEDI